MLLREGGGGGKDGGNEFPSLAEAIQVKQRYLQALEISFSAYNIVGASIPDVVVSPLTLPPPLFHLAPTREPTDEVRGHSETPGPPQPSQSDSIPFIAHCRHCFIYSILHTPFSRNIDVQPLKGLMVQVLRILKRGI